VSDDLEMGGVLSAAPIEQAAAGHIRAGGDLCLICHKEEFVARAYEELIRAAAADRAFAKRVTESAKRVLSFKKKNKQLARWAAPPTVDTIQRLSRRLWEFGEQVRLEAIQQQETA
jgi:beta-glucosidase-like glycosyl hydrolase